MIYYTDGFHNHDEYGYCVVDVNNNLIKTESFVKDNWGDGTSNIAEYLGVINAMFLAERGDTIVTDSLLVVNQVNGKWKVKKEHLVEYCLKAKYYLLNKKLRLVWIRRDKNLAGILNDKLKH